MVQKMVYFKGKRTSPTRLFDEKGLIGTFTNRGGSVVRQADGSLTRADDQLWIMEIPESDVERIERVQKYPGYGTKFNQISHLPTAGGASNINHGIGSFDKMKAEAELAAQAKVKAENEAKLVKFKRFYQLESKLLKKDGTPIKGSDAEELKELEELKQELEI